VQRTALNTGGNDAARETCLAQASRKREYPGFKRPRYGGAGQGLPGNLRFSAKNLIFRATGLSPKPAPPPGAHGAQKIELVTQSSRRVGADLCPVTSGRSPCQGRNWSGDRGNCRRSLPAHSSQARGRGLWSMPQRICPSTDQHQDARNLRETRKLPSTIGKPIPAAVRAITRTRALGSRSGRLWDDRSVIPSAFRRLPVICDGTAISCRGSSVGCGGRPCRGFLGLGWGKT
jgi:hypothetical protein